MILEEPQHEHGVVLFLFFGVGVRLEVRLGKPQMSSKAYTSLYKTVEVRLGVRVRVARPYGAEAEVYASIKSIWTLSTNKYGTDA